MFGEGEGLSAWLEDNSTLLVWLTVLSIASLVLSALLLPVVVVRLPEDHFVKGHREPRPKRGAWQWLRLVGRNLAGFVFVVAGVLMLVLPGQGLLTILIGLLLVDFPGKRGLERWFVRRRGVLKFLNRMREKRGKPPLRLE